MRNIKKISSLFLSVLLLSCATVQTNTEKVDIEKLACNTVTGQVTRLVEQININPEYANTEVKLETKYCGLLAPRDMHSGIAYMTLVLTNPANHLATESGFLVKFLFNGTNWQIIAMDRLFTLSDSAPISKEKSDVGQSI